MGSLTGPGIPKPCNSSRYLCRVLALAHIKQRIRQIKPLLAERFHVSSIGLFGSVVREDFEPAKSDVDIIVEFSQPVGIEFIDLADFLEASLDRKIDLVSKKGIKPNYLAQIESEIVYV
jgi:hypothetical protein